MKDAILYWVYIGAAVFWLIAFCISVWTCDWQNIGLAFSFTVGFAVFAWLKHRDRKVAKASNAG